eukprot:CAMPEP_0119433694 /NCGR_PEP_ID=MMETSP1335-20130426/50043_1 /TAXON_ID=259385 /ORGANISM="Chrysoculter rhomboideus, Strain RCC1486" /LENGTH=168 /DNA_ID=CAMNT_0007459539 /DNA_START=50 /DNA_END=551 /DNA_ORIENTATION=+
MGPSNTTAMGNVVTEAAYRDDADQIIRPHTCLGADAFRDHLGEHTAKGEEDARSHCAAKAGPAEAHVRAGGNRDADDYRQQRQHHRHRDKVSQEDHGKEHVDQRLEGLDDVNERKRTRAKGEDGDELPNPVEHPQWDQLEQLDVVELGRGSHAKNPHMGKINAMPVAT